MADSMKNYRDLLSNARQDVRFRIEDWSTKRIGVKKTQITGKNLALEVRMKTNRILPDNTLVNTLFQQHRENTTWTSPDGQ